MSRRRHALLFLIVPLIGHTAASSWYHGLGPHRPHLRDETSKKIGSFVRSWLDRQACNWLGACEIDCWRNKISIGLAKAPGKQAIFLQEEDPLDEMTMRPNSSSNSARVLNEIPQYVLDYAPLVHLYSEEKFWPCDMAEHLIHVTPELNYTQLQSRSQNLALTNLDELNEWDRGRFVYLTSKDNVEERPDWLGGEKNIPDKPEKPAGKWDDDNLVFGHGIFEDDAGLVRDKKESEKYFLPRQQRGQDRVRSGLKPRSKRHSANKAEAGIYSDRETTKPALDEIKRRQLAGRSDAPAVLIVVHKAGGIIDAFWFFFYSYNLGNSVFNVRFGNHVGDWEHTLVRFQDGKPKYVFFSEHNFGEAYSYGAVEKIGKRPVIYSATGTHAMYALPGFHPYVLPLGILHDRTDRGPLWDPLLNSHTYTYDHLADNLRASNFTPHAPTQWFYFAGHWGDKVYPLDDERQYEFAGQYHYVTGPLGPRFKNLGRRKICQGHYSDPCVIKNWLAPITMKYWKGMGDGEDEGDLEN